VRGTTIFAMALLAASLGVGQSSSRAAVPGAPADSAIAHKATEKSGTKAQAGAVKGNAASTKSTAASNKSSSAKAVAAKGNLVSTKSGVAKSTVTKSAAAKSVSAAPKSGVRTAPHTTTASVTGKAPPKRVATRLTTGVTTRTAPRYASQQQPAPDRYREIQPALADKGYFRGSVDGTWGADSMDALKRFQTEQNLDADGKIGALSLIALGLGPRRENASIRSAPSPDKGPEISPLPVPDPAQTAPVAVP
jgi:hypothetical protein